MRDKLKIWLFRKLEFTFIYLEAKCIIYFRTHKRKPLGEAIYRLGEYFGEWQMYFYQYKFGLIEKVYGEQDWCETLPERYLLSEDDMGILKPKLKNHLEEVIEIYKSKKYTSY